MKDKIDNLLNALPVRNANYVLHKAKSRGFNLKKQIHDECEIIFVDYGCVELTVRNEVIMLKPGECALIPSMLEHHFHGVGGRPFDFLNIAFYGNIDSSIASKAIFLNHDERTIMLKMKNEYLTENRFCHELIVIMLNQLLLLLQRRLSESCFEQDTVKITGENNLNHRTAVISRALNFIRNNYMRDITAESVSKHSGVSASYLRNLMQRETGHNFRHHLREIRMETAQHLLRESTDNISDIAAKVGYSSLPHFCEAFKKTAGMTPTEFARSLGSPSMRN
ncbi:MAG: helix-turn-helix domain-containing protein [Victivallaceae bacterium]|jgi:AraC-like DNA-binding protein